jgi:RNA polymerase sigma-70 factor (ECF subfamily)
MVTLSDRDLATRVRHGDKDAFGELVRRYQTSIFNVCYRLAGESREAEDLAQEAFVRAYERFDRYDLERPFGPWMRRVATNLCLNHLSTRVKAAFSLDDERDEPPSGVDQSPEGLSLRAERAEVLRAAILALPPHYRAVIELRHFQDLSYAQIAEQLGIPLSDVKSHLFRARRSLEKKMRPYE